MGTQLSSGRAERLVRSTPSRTSEELVPREVLDLLIRRECARADRNGREFSLVLFRVKNQKRTAVSTHRLARTILERARLTDEIGWFSDQYICALLPDTGIGGAQIFMNSVCDIVERRAPRPLAVIYSYPGNVLTADNAAQPLGHVRGDRFNDDDNDRNHPGGGHNHREPVGHASRANGNGHNSASLFRVGGNGVPAAGSAVRSSDSAQVTLTRSDLLPALSEGLAAEFNAAGMPAASIHDFLVQPIPFWKRGLDIVGAATALTIFSPLIALIALTIKLTKGGPVLFSQQRAGLGGKPFRIYKFRTMVVDAEAQKQALRKFSEQDGPAFKLKNDPRVTPLGRILRKTSLDELPQLWNVLRGDMSLVGPRPLPLEEAEKCLQWQRRRLDVTPGLTCIWQVKGRSTVSFAEWIRMDVEYIRRRTILHDLSLLAMTIPAVLLRRGAR